MTLDDLKTIPWSDPHWEKFNALVAYLESLESRILQAEEKIKTFEEKP